MIDNVPARIMGSVGLSGFNGFLGSHIARAALTSGIALVPLTRDDLAAADLHMRLRNVDCVIGAHGAVGNRSLEELRDSNLHATAALAIACHAARTRYVHVSTGAVLGSRLVDDSTVLTPRTPYAKSKAEAERVVDKYRQRGLEALIARPTSVHGPGRPRTRQLIRFLKRYPVPVTGTGDGPFPFSSVEYVAPVLLELALRKAVPNKPIVVAEPRPPTAREFLEAWTAASGKKARILSLRPAAGRALARGLEVMDSLPIGRRLPTGAVELLRYQGWCSHITEFIELPVPPLVDVLKNCIASTADD